MDIKVVEDCLRKSFANHFSLVKKRDGLYQLMIPVFHPDGDMFDIFLQINDVNAISIIDCGLTLMRLSYVFDIDTDNKTQLLHRIVYQARGNIDLETGVISMSSTLDQLFNNIMQFTQLITSVLSFTLLQRKTVASIFYEKVNKFVNQSLNKYLFQEGFIPLSDETDLKIDYVFKNNNKSIFLFPVSSESKAKDIIINIYTLQVANYPFMSVVVHDSYDKLSKSTQKKIMKLADKQFYDFSDFEEVAPNYFKKVLA